MPFLLAASAVVPALLLLWFFHARDAYPEPPRLVWATFGLGVVSVGPAILLEVPLLPVWASLEDPWAGGFLNAFAGAAVPEELCKFLILSLFCMRRSAFNETMDGLVYGAAASMGFAAAENLLYVVEGGVHMAALRAITAVPFHALNGATMGYFLALSRFVPGARARFLGTGLLIPIAVHGLYDWPLMTAERFPENSAARLLAPASVLVLALAAGMVASLLHRLRALQAAYPESGQPQEPLLAYHRRPLRFRPWLAVLAGGSVLWIGGVLGVGAALSGNGAAAPLFLVPVALGLGLFRKGVSGLNRLDGGPKSNYSGVRSSR